MLAQGRVFEIDGSFFSVLEPVRDADGKFVEDRIWCIDVDSPTAWPVEFSASHVQLLPEVPVDLRVRTNLTDKEKELKNKAWGILSRLVNDPDRPRFHLFNPSLRKAAIAKLVATLAEEAGRAKELGLKKETCTEPTLYKWLRRYWQRGQRPAALTPDYVKSAHTGKSKSTDLPIGFTSNRGRQSKRFESYQLTGQDLDNMRWAIDNKLSAKERKTLPDAWRDMLTARYSVPDGNGKPHHKPEGQRPTFDQFRYFYLRNYDAKARRLHKVDQRQYNLNYRPQTGLAITEAHGPGHQYEVDATIIECTCVTKTSRKRLIGKPTLYLVIDRWSRLIVGYCLTLEKPSWIAALLAILSISEDKEALCRKYGVTYNPSEWPAHTYFPQLFKADRGSEWTSGNSRFIVDDLGSTVENLPTGRAEMKPIVENAMKLILKEYRRFERSSEPDSQRGRGRPNYVKLASANIDEMHKFTIEAIIKLNKTQYPDWPLTPDMLAEEIKPKPINLWNYGIGRTGLLPRYHEEQVRYALLPRGTAMVNEHAINFNGRAYWSAPAAAEKWFDEGLRNSFPVEVSWDPRSVDRIYVFPRSGRGGKPHVATLSDRSDRFGGRSHWELQYLDGLDTDMRAAAWNENKQEEADFIDRTAPVSDKAFKEMKAETKGSSMASRKKNIKEDRAFGLEDERRSRELVKDFDPAEAEFPTPAEPLLNGPALHLVASSSTQATAPTPGKATDDVAAKQRKVADSTAEQLAAFRRKLGLAP